MGSFDAVIQAHTLPISSLSFLKDGSSVVTGARASAAAAAAAVAVIVFVIVTIVVFIIHHY